MKELQKQEIHQLLLLVSMMLQITPLILQKVMETKILLLVVEKEEMMLQITPLILQKVETRKILKQVMVKVERMMLLITLKILQKEEMKEKTIQIMILKSLMLEKMMRLISYKKMYLLI